MASFNISCREGLLLMNSFSFNRSKKVCVSLFFFFERRYRIGKEFELDSFPLSTYGEKPEIRASAQWKPAEGSRPGF